MNQPLSAHDWQSSWSWRELAPKLTEIDDWSHSGVSELSSGEIVVSTPGSGTISLIFDDRVETLVLDKGIFHGITADKTAAGDFVWLADIGVEQPSARIILLEISTGEFVDHSPSESELPGVSSWRPTAIAIERSVSEPEGYAIWVADGYGNSNVHRIEAGRVTLTLDGSSSGLVFDCPHGIAVDTRFSPPQIVVADRNNERLVWFSLEGDYLHSLVSPLINSPSGLALSGEKLFVTELHGGLISVTKSLEVVDELPRSSRDRSSPWPNQGDVAAPKRPSLSLGVLNSPHGICATSSGSLVITEWLIGGRTVKLTPLG